MFGKIQTTVTAAALVLAASSATAGFSSNEMKLAKATSDDLACHTFAIELKSAKQRGGFNYFPDVDKHCVQRIMVFQPEMLETASVTRNGGGRYSQR